MRYAIGLFLICLLILNNCATTYTVIENTSECFSYCRYLNNKKIIYSGSRLDLEMIPLFFNSSGGSSASAFGQLLGFYAIFDLSPSFALDTLLLPITISVVGFLYLAN